MILTTTPSIEGRQIAEYHRSNPSLWDAERRSIWMPLKGSSILFYQTILSIAGTIDIYL